LLYVRDRRAVIVFGHASARVGFRSPTEEHGLDLDFSAPVPPTANALSSASSQRPYCTSNCMHREIKRSANKGQQQEQHHRLSLSLYSLRVSIEQIAVVSARLRKRKAPRSTSKQASKQATTYSVDSRESSRRVLTALHCILNSL
jgi:hypothetical protein